MGKGISDITGNINCLYFKRSKVINAPLVIVSTEDYIDISG